ncbi:rRNA-processing protein utp23 [Rutidosis leptorrhynchoides]|uniref:rRNA-processing protein utp23 n=1 Tax=Rutidosis leptorrhynchoides TaxID=125765 RepID=UPI003A998970
MGIKKQKRHRRIVRFYKTCFGFRPPFKVLCDGTFIHHLFINNIIPADTSISKILGDPVKLFTTRCVLAELKSLGEGYSDSLNVGRDLVPARCDHEKRKSAVDCLTEVIGDKNSEHFFVASQDADLRKKFQEIAAVPVIFALRNALFLEPPSESQHQFANSAEEERSHMTDLEFKMLFKKRKRSASEETGDSSDENEDLSNKIVEDLKKNSAKRKGDVKDKVQFKRKRAKGPNPLSCKKKKTENQKPVAKKESNNNENKTQDDSLRSRNKKRKRSRKKKDPTDATD